jgi:hypothetical protein
VLALDPGAAAARVAAHPGNRDEHVSAC